MNSGTKNTHILWLLDSANRRRSTGEAFVQEDLSDSRKYGGAGLVLPISNELLAHMDSRLKLESEKGKGSLFYFTIECPAQV